MERFSSSRRAFGIFARTAVASAIVASMTLGAGATHLGRKNAGYALSVEDGSYAQSTTAWVAAPAGTTANASTSPQLWVYARCYQDGRLVYWEAPEVTSAMTATLTLGPTDWWTSGAADCTADLQMWDVKRAQWKTLAHSTFQAAG